MRLQFYGVILLSLFGTAASADPAEFEQCKTQMQLQASAQGVSEATVKEVIPTLEYQARVIELDRSQPEFTQSFADYFGKRVSQSRIDKGRELYAQYRDFLAELTRKYGVPGQYLVAFWGLETNFGSYLGGMPTLDSLATLACDPRRSEFFTTEFLLALKLLERENLRVDDMKGSWAGAVGHTQFMPSSYLRYAIDGDDDGSIDLWSSRRDALASAAHFLSQLGWQRQQRWGREVKLPADYDFTQAVQQRPLQDWRSLGLRNADGGPLPVVIGMDADLIIPSGHKGPVFLVYDNFDVIMQWNRSTSYALSVGHLADRIAGAGALKQSIPKDQVRLRRADVVQMQELLIDKGFDAGVPDGLLGPTTRSALREFQISAGLVGDGFPDRKTLTQLGVDY
ncbi:glycosidase family protein [Luminiphilus syltensis NOR5-1B]|uniref:Glycosidase family protein n=1 Tax=Luminiphilus syltensis NOR5-1B TaxID=565045 RepID=B8KVK2_9GAMM|nr:lytic murein transglycosylase [Luminiphilus syltensis]EED34610.1 glycosidase family protein [Luminiphilus syltensis NOR5-1B]